MKSNAKIQQDVNEELKWDPRIKEGDIGVAVKDGVVTLSGSIPSYAEKNAAVKAAQKVTGVSAVVDEIQVKLSGSMVRDDRDIANACSSSLRWNIWVPQDAVKITVKNGWITLTGEVEYEFKRAAAYNAVRDLEGVRGVSNEITVKPMVRSADVKQKIESALIRHAREDADNIKISVRDQDVTLSGKAPSWSERQQAEWAAWGTPGVKSVTNLVSIQN